MDILQRVDGEAFRLQRSDGLNRGAGTGQGGDCRHRIVERSAADVAIVVGCLSTNGCVDRQLNSTRPNLIFDIRAPLMHLQHRGHVQAGLLQHLGGACGSGEFKAKLN